MKKSLLLLFSVLALSCNYQNKPSTKLVDENNDYENFDWLLGNWERTNNDEGKMTFETWKKENDSLYIGFGYTLSEADTVSQEQMAVLKDEGKWQLEVLAPGDSIVTIFKITTQKKSEFIAENKNNEFPVKIEYKKAGKELKAIVSNSEFEIPFDFKQIREFPK